MGIPTRATLMARSAAEKFFYLNPSGKVFRIKKNAEECEVLSLKPSRAELKKPNEVKMTYKADVIKQAIEEAGIPEDFLEIWVQETFKKKSEVRATVLFWRAKSGAWIMDEEHPQIVPHEDLDNMYDYDMIIVDPNGGSRGVTMRATGLKKKQRNPNREDFRYAIVGTGKIEDTEKVDVSAFIKNQLSEKDIHHPLYKSLTKMYEISDPEDELENVNAAWEREKKKLEPVEGKKTIVTFKDEKDVYLLAANASIVRKSNTTAFYDVVAAMPVDVFSNDKPNNAGNMIATKPSYVTIREYTNLKNVMWYKPTQRMIVHVKTPIAESNTKPALPVLSSSEIVVKRPLEKLHNASYIAGLNAPILSAVPVTEMRDAFLQSSLAQTLFVEKKKRKRSEPTDSKVLPYLNEGDDSLSAQENFGKLQESVDVRELLGSVAKKPKL